MIVMIVGLVEAVAYLCCQYMASKGALYKPHQDLSDIDLYLAQRDNTLGWRATRFSQANQVDKSGSRITPAYPDPDVSKPCVSIYGDSFAWADEVDAEHAWPNVLSRQLGCRVSNFGVPAYGSDQAFLRFRENRHHDSAPIVILTHLSENILRNVSQDLDLIYPSIKYGLKPRFRLDDHRQLVWVPLPLLSKEQIVSLNQDPARFLSHEQFLTAKIRFPYTLSVLKGMGNYRITGKLFRRPRYGAFYAANHPSQALQITTEILKQFCLIAKARRKTPIIFVLPTKHDFLYDGNRPWVYQPLIDELKRQALPVVDIGQRIKARLGDQDALRFYATGHFNEAGNRLLAEIAAKVIFDMNLLNDTKDAPASTDD